MNRGLGRDLASIIRDGVDEGTREAFASRHQRTPAESTDEVTTSGKRWSVKRSATSPGVVWLIRDGVEAGSLQLLHDLATPATTIALILAALEQDGAS